MPLPRAFLDEKNFELAFERVARAARSEQKQQYRHLLPSYQAARKVNLAFLVERLRTGAYKPQPPRPSFTLKPSGTLRPTVALALNDHIVFQAIANVVADKCAPEQYAGAHTRRFSNLYGGRNQPYFLRHWERGYRRFQGEARVAYAAGNEWVADLDLASFFDVIDHEHLRETLAKRGIDGDLLRLLTECLPIWSGASDPTVRHGIPQDHGPAAFLAEVFLFDLDATVTGAPVYLRYVDDIRLMGPDEETVRTAARKIEIAAQNHGLTVQAAKVHIRHVTAAHDLAPALASLPGGARPLGAGNLRTQADFMSLLRGSTSGRGAKKTVNNDTHFRFALNRLNPRQDAFRLIRPLLVNRPDLAPEMGRYLSQFSNDAGIAVALGQALAVKPLAGVAASAYLDALHANEPTRGTRDLRRTAATTVDRVVEPHSAALAARHAFLATRRRQQDVLAILRAENNPVALTLCIESLGKRSPGRLMQPAMVQFLADLANHQDEDLSRYAAAIVATQWHTFGQGQWRPGNTISDAAKLLLVGLGMRRRGPRRVGVIENWFQEEMQIATQISWRKALKRDWGPAGQHLVDLQKFRDREPDAFVLALDTFNEILIQNFSARHPTLATPYRVAAGARTSGNPDIGAWLGQAHLSAILPVAGPWFVKVHRQRVASRLAHAKNRNGAPNRTISHENARQLMKGARRAWDELIAAWAPLL